MFVIFDLIFILTSLFFHYLAALITFQIISPFWPEQISFQLLALGIAYFLFLHLFPLLIGIFRFILQPRIKVGSWDIGLNKGYLSYVINSLFFGAFISSPIHRHCLFILYLRWMFYRLFGMKVPYN